MRFLVDENLPISLALTARERGHEATWTRDVLPGAPDTSILVRLRETGEVLVTRDIRFANLVLGVIGLESGPGLVVLIREQKMSKVEQAWARFLRSPREIRGIAVLTAERTRCRQAPPR